jgi:DNA-binding HxlR family transcriptional regulator
MTTTAAEPQAPPALAFSVENCTVGRAMAILGEKWTFVVLREVFNGVRRFDDMRRHTSIPRQVLTNRLALLVEHRILRKEPYQSPGERARHEYRLTAKGIDLYPVLIAISQWGDRYLADPTGPPVEFAHRDCGALMHVVPICAAGHEVDELRQIAPRPGPGATPLSG